MDVTYFWVILSTINFAIFDFIFVEIVTYFLEKKTRFRKSEWYVFGIMVLSLIFFYISNLVQDSVVMLVNSLNWYWITLIFVIASSFSMVFLAKAILKRKWEFRLVLYP